MAKAKLSTVVATGDRRKSLEAVRAHLAQALESADERYVAALAKQLLDTMAELDALPGAKEVSAVDDLARKRSARRSEPQLPQRAATGELGGRGGGRARGERGAGT